MENQLQFQRTMAATAEAAAMLAKLNADREERKKQDELRMAAEEKERRLGTNLSVCLSAFRIFLIQLIFVNVNLFTRCFSNKMLIENHVFNFLH